jgi:hypothetical protein
MAVLAIGDTVTRELRIPKARYDAINLLQVVQRLGSAA